MGLAGQAQAITAKAPQQGGPLSGPKSSVERLQELQAKAPTQVSTRIIHPPFNWLSSY
jgi:hypothetical protein